METMLEAVARLRGEGYLIDLSAAPGVRLRCGDCGGLTAAADAIVEQTVRFEGDSDPDDEEILVALSLGCGHRGLYQAAYGPDAPPDDIEVLRALAGR